MWVLGVGEGFFSLPPPTKDPPARIVIMSYIDLTCLKDEKEKNAYAPKKDATALRVNQIPSRS